MNILIVFDTYSGGTLDAATFMQDTLSKQGHTPIIKRVNSVTAADFSAAEFVVFATPSWMVDDKDGQPHINFKKLTQSSEDFHLKDKKVAVLGLGDESYAHFGGGADVLTTFAKEKGAFVVSPPLKIDSYYANQENSHKKIAEWIGTLNIR